MSWDEMALPISKHEGATRAHPDNPKTKVKNFSRASRGIIHSTARLFEYATTATGPPQISWLRPRIKK